MLFWKKKKTPPVESFAGAEKRRAARYTTIAGIRINGMEGDAVVRDINKGGFRIASRTFVAINPQEQYAMQIIPDTASGVGPFELHVEVRWIRHTESLFAAGFVIVSPPMNESLQRYVNYLKKLDRRKQAG
ncbi:hypothetical protein AGMMS49579_18310 [Spirochaetia bacterium]|nr:hypothetical protein AGMMS49579_18310 [Spirochaetia bacterium]